jgi:hypothetical protein
MNNFSVHGYSFTNKAAKEKAKQDIVTKEEAENIWKVTDNEHLAVVPKDKLYDNPVISSSDSNNSQVFD